MSKWRAIQHRHRYTYNAVRFPPHFFEAFHQTPSVRFYTELKRLISLNSTYAQLTHAKNIASAFTDMLSDPNGDVESILYASKLYMEILFLENSMPLYRTLVSVFSKAKNYQDLIVKCFRELCEEYGGENGKGSRFSVCRVALLIMGTPKLGYMSEVVKECAVLVGLDVVSGLKSVLLEVGESSRPSPLVMEQCQEALSSTYYLLQRYPEKFRVSVGGCADILEPILTTILSILNSEGFSRDCLVAAGVSLCAALQGCLSPEELGLFIMEGVFNHTPVLIGDISLNVLLGRIPFKGKVIGEIHRFSTLSRLCLIRGILTSVSREVLNSVFVILNGCSGGDIASSGDGTRSVKTILYDGILPELCYYCENPIDSHFNFHALTVMQMCLQQIKTSIQCNVGKNTEDYDLFSESMGARTLRIMWNNLEDPLSQTVKQVYLIFDLFLDIQGSLHLADGSEKNRSFLRGIASDLLRLGPRCKGRYIPLALLTKRLGAKTLLGMKPDLLFETTEGYIDDDVCSAATNFLKCFLECLRDEYWNSDGVENGYTKYRGQCLPPFVDGLSSGVPKLRTNLNTYALPVLLALDEDSIFFLLASLGVQLAEGESEIVYPDFRSIDECAGAEHKVAVLVSLLKVARGLALIEGDLDWYENLPPFSEKLPMNAENNDIYALVSIKGIKVKIPVRWLLLALTHTDDALRIDAAETLFLNPKSASLPSSLELRLMRDAVPLNMRCSSTAFQMKWSSLFRKFFSRVRTALEKQFKLGNWQPLESKNHTSVLSSDEIIGERASDVFNFMRWLSCFLFLSCYPSAPYERKIMAMELILIMLSVWSMMNPLQGNDNLVSANTSLYPYGSWFTLPESALLLVGSIVDSWDRLRESSFRILLHFPTPLPGIHSPDMVEQAIIWAKRLVCSPRVRESDAGALTLRLIFRKYVVDLGWIVRPSSNSVSSHLQPELSNGNLHNTTQGSPVMEYIRSLIDWLLLSIEEGEKDLSEACKDSFVHGILLTLRYTFEELDWSSDVLSNAFEMKLALGKLLELVMRITSLALGVVSADAWHLPDDMEDDNDDFTLEVVVETGAAPLIQEDEGNTTKYVRDVRPSEQIVMVGCWLAMKEVSLLLGTIIRKVPLPTSDASDLRMQDIEKDCGSRVTSGAILDLNQLQIIGNHFLEVILKMKHMGAIDKTRAGFTALCNRLLSSDDSRLCKLTESWMEQLMERMVAKGQTVDDVLRRSAGIPAAFSAFFLSEPEGTPKRLLPRALRWLIDIAKKPLADQESENSPGAGICNSSTNLNEVHQLEPILSNDNENISKIRDEGVVPTVHAFNVLRATFNDTNLATDTSGFSADAMIIAIRSFSSSYWEVRNGACQAYTALVRRMIGFLNVQKRESVRRALTGLEFFHRYPLLHTFLLSELRIATEMLTNGSSEHLGANLKNVVHPSLCPMLILLSRLKPSAIASNAGDSLDPALFMPFIRSCSIQSNYKIRVLASRALTGLVSNEKLPLLLLNIVSEIPSEEYMGSDLPSSLNLNRCSYNSVHGMLLQLNALLDTNCRNLTDSSKKDAILGDLTDVLVSRSWIGRPHKCFCPTLSTCLLQVLDNMLSISKSCELRKSAGPIRKILLELTSECLDTGRLLGPSYYDPTLTELRRQAVISFFNCVRRSPKEVTEEDVTWTTDLSKASDMDVSSSKFKEKLLGCMSDASYEVRVAALKWLFSFLKETKPIGDNSGPKCEVGKVLCANIDLHSVLAKLLSDEKNNKCTYYILKIMYSWNVLCFQLDGQHTSDTLCVENMNHDSVFQFWDKLVYLYKMTRHAKTRQALICCLGVCVKRISGIFLSSICLDKTSNQSTEYTHSDPEAMASFYDRINYFVDLIKEHSNAAEPVNMRRAAAESIAASGLLDQAQALGFVVSNVCMPHQNQYSRFSEKEAINMYAHRVLDLWLMSIKLLEDEDEELRRQLALDMQRLAVLKDHKIGSSTGVVPSQVEKVIEMCVAHLSSIFGHWVDYIDFLCHWVLSAANSANYDASVGDLVRRVFDKEIDNHHEEKLLICQICCYHLEKLPLTKSSTVGFCDRGQIRNFLSSWRERFCQQLMTFVNDHVGEQLEGMDWIGGVGNHKDAFLPIYANLLAIYALSNCLRHDQETEDSDYSLSELTELGQLIRPFTRNPQIGNLYKLIVKSHENVFGSVAHHLAANSSEYFGVWEEFDPYFLLR
ncbi:scaffold/adaptor protein [Lithospermum erythrorhizon]|uniref:Scaffold/adaptor protein n=1 Tax=Lithospermum erythrorhizon TaxID=34254 RepID=A0AAV3QYK7_LITER